MLVEESASNEVAQSSALTDGPSGSLAEEKDNHAVLTSPAVAEGQQLSLDVHVLDLQGDLVSDEPPVAEKSAEVMSSLPEPLLPDSVLARVDPPSSTPRSDDHVFSVSDSALAQVSIPPPLDAAALDLAPPDENGDDDDMGDSATLHDDQELAAAWKCISHKKGKKKNLARKASSATSDLFLPVWKAFHPSLPGVRSSRRKDPPK